MSTDNLNAVEDSRTSFQLHMTHERRNGAERCWFHDGMHSNGFCFGKISEVLPDGRILVKIGIDAGSEFTSCALSHFVIVESQKFADALREFLTNDANRV